MEKLIVDERGSVVPAADGTVAGRRVAVPVPSRLVWASMSARYHPSHPPGESCLFGVDFSFCLPAGSMVTEATLQIFANTFAAPPAPEWVVGGIVIDGVRVWARLTGGTEGVDYQLLFTATDTDGNIWPRTAFVLCSRAS